MPQKTCSVPTSRKPIVVFTFYATSSRRIAKARRNPPGRLLEPPPRINTQQLYKLYETKSLTQQPTSPTSLLPCGSLRSPLHQGPTVVTFGSQLISAQCSAATHPEVGERHLAARYGAAGQTAHGSWKSTELRTALYRLGTQAAPTGPNHVGGYLVRTNQPVPESDGPAVQAPSGAVYLVKPSSRTCSCTVFQQNGIPCAHGMGFLHQKGVRPETFLPHYFTLETLRDSYSPNIRPTTPQNLEVPVQIQPPSPRKTTGRKKKNRAEVGDGSRKRQRRTDTIPAPAEPGDRPSHYCSRCGKPGHNMRTCAGKDWEGMIEI